MDRDFFNSAADIKFSDLLKICSEYFGDPMVIGCHYVFGTPWIGDPVISIQFDGETAKPYQVRKVEEALKKLEVMNEKH